MIKLLKSVLFYPLMFLRSPVKICLWFVMAFGVLGLISIVAAHYMGEPDGEPFMWSLFLFSLGLAFGSFLLRWFYDLFLIKLNPSDAALILY